MGTTALLSLIPLHQTSQWSEKWVLPTYWAVGISSTILAVAMFTFGRQRRKHIESSCEEVLHDMSDINECYFPGETMDQQITLPPEYRARWTFFRFFSRRRRG